MKKAIPFITILFIALLVLLLVFITQSGSDFWFISEVDTHPEQSRTKVNNDNSDNVNPDATHEQDASPSSQPDESEDHNLDQSHMDDSDSATSNPDAQPSTTSDQETTTKDSTAKDAVSGIIVNAETGRPMPDINLSLYDDRYQPKIWIASTTTNKDGEYRFDQLIGLIYHMYVEVDGYAIWDGSYFRDYAFLIATSKPEPKTVQMQPVAGLRGRLLAPDGIPFSTKQDIELSVFVLNKDDSLLSSISGNTLHIRKDGRFFISLEEFVAGLKKENATSYPNRFRLRFSTLEFLPFKITTPGINHEKDIINLHDLQFKLGHTLQGRVTNEEGNPISNASVEVYEMSSIEKSYRLLALKTDPNGNFKSNALACDKVQLLIERETFIAKAIQVYLPVKNKAIQLQKGVSVIGSATDESGGALKTLDIVLLYFIRLPDGNDHQIQLRTSTTENGIFTFKGVPPKKVKVALHNDIHDRYFDPANDEEGQSIQAGNRKCNFVCRQKCKVSFTLYDKDTGEAFEKSNRQSRRSFSLALENSMTKSKSYYFASYPSLLYFKPGTHQLVLRFKGYRDQAITLVIPDGVPEREIRIDLERE